MLSPFLYWSKEKIDFLLGFCGQGVERTLMASEPVAQITTYVYAPNGAWIKITREDGSLLGNPRTTYLRSLPTRTRHGLNCERASDGATQARMVERKMRKRVRRERRIWQGTLESAIFFFSVWAEAVPEIFLDAG